VIAKKIFFQQKLIRCFCALTLEEERGMSENRVVKKALQYNRHYVTNKCNINNNSSEFLTWPKLLLLLLLVSFISTQCVYNCIKLYIITQCCSILVVTVYTSCNVIFSLLLFFFSNFMQSI
jgi:hypothetical protein